MPPRAHAVLPPSSAKRWINCPPSALDNAKAPEVDNPNAREGTVAHALAEVEAGYHFGLIDRDTYEKGLSSVKAAQEYNDEMAQYVRRHVEMLWELYDDFPDPPQVRLETRVDMRRWAPECFGTADVMMIGMDTIHIIDFKYGVGVSVDADHNPQMMLYALGVLDRYGDLFDQQEIKMTIIQPRLRDYPSTFTMSRDDLLKWAEEVLKPAAEKAFQGEGERACGDWCRWCCNNGNCVKQLEEFDDLPVETDPNKLTDEQIDHALKLGEMLSNWLDAVKAMVLERCMDGKPVSGWKAVEGRKSRNWTSQDDAFRHATENGIPEEMLYERKPLSVAALEKVVGKKKFGEMMKAYVTTVPGKPTLAPADDRREAITNKSSIDADFA